MSKDQTGGQCQYHTHYNQYYNQWITYSGLGKRLHCCRAHSGYYCYSARCICRTPSVFPSFYITGGAVLVTAAQSVERATLRKEFNGSSPLCGRPLPIMWPTETEIMVSPLWSRVWQHTILADSSLGTRLWYSLVADKDVKKSKWWKGRIERYCAPIRCTSFALQWMANTCTPLKLVKPCVTLLIFHNCFWTVLSWLLHLSLSTYDTDFPWANQNCEYRNF